MKSDTATISEAIRLHGMAWMALNRWCEFVLGERFLEKNDNLYAARDFYPVGIIAAAQKELNRTYHAGRADRKRARGR